MTRPEAARRDADGHLPEELLTAHALGEDLTPDDAAHLTGCPVCRAELDGWLRLVRAGRSRETVRPLTPPPGTWEAIARETGVSAVPADGRGLVAVPALGSGTLGSTALGAGAGDAARADRPRRRAPSRASRWLPVAAALLVGLVGGAVGARVLDGPDPSGAVVATAALTPLADGDAGDGTGEAEITTADGHRRLDLRVSGLGAPAGGVLEVWLLDPDGGLVSLGPLVGDAFDAPLPDDVDLDRFSVVDVSREPLDGDPAHSADSALRGTLRPSA